MAGFDPTLLMLVSIYADSVSDRQQTSVYGNGYMQVCVSLSFNYKKRCDSDCMVDLNKHVQDKAGVLSMDIHGDLHPLGSEWVRSTTDNGFYHDINHPIKGSPGFNVVSDIRVELFYTVPKSAVGGELSWVGEMEDQQTNSSTPLVVNVEEFYADKDYLEIVDLYTITDAKLRVMKYKHGSFPDVAAQRLVSLDENKGLYLKDNGGNSWILMLQSSSGHKACAIPKPGVEQIKVANDCYKHTSFDVTSDVSCPTGNPGYYETDCHTYWEAPADFSKSEVVDAFDQGIPMVLMHGSKLSILTDKGHACNIVIEEFVVVDSFAGRIKIKMEWSVGGSWYGTWAIKSATVI